MYGIEELEISRLHREEVAREVRLGRLSGTRPSAGGSGAIWDFGRLFRIARNVG